MINSTYAEKGITNRLKDSYEKNHILKLDAFLNEKYYNSLSKKINQLKYKKVKIPDKYSYSKAKNINIEKEIKNFIELITDKKIKNIKIEKFSHRDYTLLHDEEKENKTEAFLFFCKKWNISYGGNLVVTTSKESRIVTPTKNSLVIINKKSEWKNFIQYINNTSKKNYFVFVRFELR